MVGAECPPPEEDTVALVSMLQRQLAARARRAAAAWQRVRDEEGITGLETAIVLIAFVVVASVFAFVVLSTGLFSSERGKEAVYAGLAKTRSSMTLASGVVATSSGLTQIDTVEFDLTLAAGGGASNLDPAATSNSTIVTYIDNALVVPDVTYTVTVLIGDADSLLEPGELLRVTVDLAAAGAAVQPNEAFTLEIKPPTGSFLVLQRTAPAALESVMALN